MNQSENREYVVYYQGKRNYEAFTITKLIYIIWRRCNNAVDL